MDTSSSSSSKLALAALLVMLLAPAVHAQCELMDDPTVPDRGGVRRCLSPALRGVNLQGELLASSLAYNCAWCRDQCLENSECNVWVYCDNENGCDNGYGQTYPKDTCTIKKADEHYLIVDITNPPAAFEKPSGAAASFDDWVSGTCNVACDCCGWCGNAHGCSGNCYYCEDTKTCTEALSLPYQIEKCMSENCDSDADLGRADCVSKNSCNGEAYRICPGRVFSAVNKVQSQDESGYLDLC